MAAVTQGYQEDSSLKVTQPEKVSGWTRVQDAVISEICNACGLKRWFHTTETEKTLGIMKEGEEAFLTLTEDEEIVRMLRRKIRY